jgi:hypothetical protein
MIKAHRVRARNTTRKPFVAKSSFDEYTLPRSSPIKGVVTNYDAQLLEQNPISTCLSSLLLVLFFCGQRCRCGLHGRCCRKIRCRLAMASYLADPNIFDHLDGTGQAGYLDEEQLGRSSSGKWFAMGWFVDRREAVPRRVYTIAVLGDPRFPFDRNKEMGEVISDISRQVRHS